MEFVECQVCAKKTGSSLLCNSCLSNRATIASLEERIEKQRIQVLLRIQEKIHGLRVNSQNAFIDGKDSYVIASLYAIDILSRLEEQLQVFFLDEKD